nr:MAG TPA: hypothetical protein [Caudoviricetes sp.]
MHKINLIMTLLITREICKTIMFTIIWALPFGLAYVFKNPVYLWFFVISFFVSTGIFSHYEDLVKEEKEEQHDK